MANLKIIILGLGWILLTVFLGSGYIMNKFKSGEQTAFTPITWAEHLSVFEGALSCSLTSAELQDRIAQLKEEIFPNVTQKVELEEGYIYYFEDKGDLAIKILEFMGKEKQCCPFFKFDFSILPFNKGLALKISGSEGVKAFLTTQMEKIEDSIDTKKATSSVE